MTHLGWMALVAAVFLEACGDYAFKAWSLRATWTWFAAGMLGYAAATAVWPACVKEIGIARIVAVYCLANIASAVLIGAWFGETLSRSHGVGLALAGLAIWLLLRAPTV